MNRILKISVAFALLFCMLSVSVGASAVEIMPFASTIIRSTAVGIKAEGGGKVKGSATISCYETCDQLTITLLKVQENRSGSWVTVASASNQYKKNVSSHSYSVSYSGTKGKTYRATASFKAVKGSTIETRSGTSGSLVAD